MEKPGQDWLGAEALERRAVSAGSLRTSTRVQPRKSALQGLQQSRDSRAELLSSKRLRSSAVHSAAELQPQQAAELTKQLKLAQPHQTAPILQELCYLLSTGMLQIGF